MDLESLTNGLRLLQFSELFNILVVGCEKGIKAQRPHFYYSDSLLGGAFDPSGESASNV